ncbi:GNAT family N-acetyltransferase, partial [bacterium 1XD42-8]
STTHFEKRYSFFHTIRWHPLHLFLSDNEIETIKNYVPEALRNISHLLIAQNENEVPVAFMGIENQKLEMLFISPEERGKGLGKKLLQYGIKNYSINELAVNEQNPQAKGFYEHMGFQVYQRTNTDEQGNPYPLLYMNLPKNYNSKTYLDKFRHLSYNK